VEQHNLFFLEKDNRFLHSINIDIYGRLLRLPQKQELSTPDRNCIGRPEQKYITG
jgi:hypothetical protein